MPPSPHILPANSRGGLPSAFAQHPLGTAVSVIRVTVEVIILKEKVADLEAWLISTEADLKEIREIISQVKLLMTLSIGGSGLSVHIPLSQFLLSGNMVKHSQWRLFRKGQSLSIVRRIIEKLGG